MADNMTHIIDCFYYNSEYKILICTECKYCIFFNNLKIHLKNFHKKIFSKVNTDYYNLFNNYEFNSFESIQTPEPFTTKFDFLIINKNYFGCKKCDFISKNKKIIQHHLNKIHNISLMKKGEDINNIYINIDVQTFFTQYKYIKYFIIKSDDNAR